MSQMRCVVFLVAVSLLAQDDVCRSLFRGPDLEAISSGKLTKTALAQLSDRRACQRSYGFPGGIEALPRLSSEQIKADRDKLAEMIERLAAMDAAKKQKLREYGQLTEWLAENYNRITTSGKSTAMDALRLRRQDRLETELKALLSRPLEAPLGTLALVRWARASQWDPRQALLYGDWAYMQALRKEGRHSEAATYAAKIVAAGKLRAGPVRLTDADQLSYFSPELLANFIIGEMHAARAAAPKTTLARDVAWLVQYLDDRPFLEKFQNVGLPGMSGPGDPLDRLLARIETAGTDRLHPLGAVAGLSPREGGTDVYLQGRKLHTLRFEGKAVRLLPDQAAWRDFRRTIGSELAARSSDRMRLFSVLHSSGEFQIDTAQESIRLTRAEVARMRKGQPLPATHELSKLIESLGEADLMLYSNPLMGKDTVFRRAADDVAFAIQKGYSNRPVYRDSWRDDTPARFARLRQFQAAGADVVAVIAEDSFEVNDAKVIANLKPELAGAGVKVVSFPKSGGITWTEGSGKAVVVITGHMSKEMEAFVDALGSAGVLRGNVVVFNSCRTPLTREVIERINVKYGATATLAHDGLIKASAVEDFLADWAERLKQPAVKPMVTELLESLRKFGLNAVWTICRRTTRPGAIES